MKNSILLFVFCVSLINAFTCQAQKNRNSGVGMNKQELVKGTSEEEMIGIQVNTKSVEEIIGTAALCKYSVKLKDPSVFVEQGACWGKEPNPDKTVNKVSVSSYEENGSLAEITGLEPNVKYYVKAYVTTNSGTVYGKELSFTTKSGQGVSTYWIRRR